MCIECMCTYTCMYIYVCVHIYNTYVSDGVLRMQVHSIYTELLFLARRMCVCEYTYTYVTVTRTQLCIIARFPALPAKPAMSLEFRRLRKSTALSGWPGDAFESGVTYVRGSEIEGGKRFRRKIKKKRGGGGERDERGFNLDERSVPEATAANCAKTRQHPRKIS